MGSFAVTYDTLTDSDLDCQVALTKRCGMRMSHQLTGKKEINEDRYSKISDAVTRDGYISLTNPGHAYRVLERLGKKVFFRKSDQFTLQVVKDETKDNDGDVIITNSRAAGSTQDLVIGRGVMRDRIVFGFALQFNIHHPDLAIRKNHLLALRKCIWHEIMETALLAINIEVFNSTNPNIWGPGNFADIAVGGIARVNESSHDHRFFPWTGDKIPSPGQGAKKQGLSLPRGPIKELKITCAARLTGTIKDYNKSRVVEKLDIPPGRTFVWGPKAEPGEYWLDAVFGSQIIENQRLELLPAKPLSLKTSFKRDQFGDLYMIIEYENWPRNKGMGIRIVGEKSKRESYKKPTDNNKERIIWGKNYDFKREDYIVEPYCDGDPFLHVWAESEKLVKPVSLDFGSRWMVELRDRCKYVRILYKDWHGYFVCKIKDPSGKIIEAFRKTDRAGYIDWGRSSNVKPGKYIIEVTIDKGVYETKTIEISE